MATLADNPYDTQQAKPKNTGIIAGAQAPAEPAYTAEKPQVKAEETTSGQLSTILDGDSPIMQRARTIAAQQANSRGLLNSSMAAEAGTAAMIDRAVPIANADANVYDNRARFNADAGNTASGLGASIRSQMEQQKSQQEFTAGQSDLDRAQQTSLQQMQTDAQRQLQESQQQFQGTESSLDRQQQTNIQQMQADAQRQLQESQQAFQEIQSQLDRDQQINLTNLQASLQDAMNAKNLPQTFAANLSINMQNAMANILANSDLKPDAKKAAISNLIDATNAQIAWASSFYSTPIPEMTDPGAATQAPRITIPPRLIR